MIAGVFFSLVGGIGLHRLPDFYSRMHAAGITDTLGATLVLAGLMLLGGASQATVKLAMILGLLLVTSPTAGHALARAALRHGLKPELDPDAAPDAPGNAEDGA
ncbi:MAG: monovalent cation/H(+) antiporter subunit G [Planctomycetota bacterium]|jgi:multicomponent Na+:H+ antiporter subunit G